MAAKSKLIALIISVSIHLILLLMFFMPGQVFQRVEARWSGGIESQGSGVDFVELGEIVVDKAVYKKPVKSKKVYTGSGKSSVSGGKGDGIDSSGSASPNVLALIRQKILSQKKYPLRARENGWGGVVRVQFKVLADGSLEYAKVLSSSGFEVLDKAALASVRGAVPLPFYTKAIALGVDYRVRHD